MGPGKLVRFSRFSGCVDFKNDKAVEIIVFLWFQRVIGVIRAVARGEDISLFLQRVGGSVRRFY